MLARWEWMIMELLVLGALVAELISVRRVDCAGSRREKMKEKTFFFSKPEKERY